MPKAGRIVLSNYPHHVVHRGHNRQVVFVAEQDLSPIVPRFSADVEAVLGRRVATGKPERPKITPDL